MKRIAFFLTAALGLLASAGQAQNPDYNGSLGNLYSSLYTSTMGAGSAIVGLNGKSPAGAVRRVSAPAKWTNRPQSSAVAKQAVTKVAPDQQAAMRGLLTQLLTAYPALLKAVGASTGTALNPNDVRDVLTVAGTVAFQELTGTELTNAQFAAERTSSRQACAKAYYTAEQMQASGEKYAIATGLMGALSLYAENPKNPNPAQTRQQLHGLAEQTFRDLYAGGNYTEFAATDKGIVKVK